jgi:hypothetical protein
MTDREKAARRLAEIHYLLEPAITEIRSISSPVRFESKSTEPIKLLEVNEDTVPSGIMPLRFDAVPSSGIRYPSVIVEVTPDEYEYIKKDELKLPNGWSLGPVLPRPNQRNGKE